MKSVKKQFENKFEDEVKQAMNTAEYIKEKLGATVIESSLVPQENGSYIIMERCEIGGRYKVVLVYDSDDESNDESNDKAVVVC